MGRFLSRFIATSDTFHNETLDVIWLIAVVVLIIAALSWNCFANRVGLTLEDFMMPNMGKRMAGSMAVMDRGITSVTQYVAISSNTNAHSASYSNKTHR